MKEFYRKAEKKAFLKAVDWLKNKKFKPKELLDLGCRDGEFTKQIKDISGAKKSFGIENYEEFYNSARKQKFLKVYALDLNKAEFPFKDGQLGLITANQTLEHIFEIDKVLDEIHRVLSPKGYFIVSTPNLAALHERMTLLLGFNPSVWQTANIQIGLRKGANTNREHVNGFTVNGLKYLLEYHGFRPEKLFVSKIYLTQNYYIPLLEKIFPSLALSQTWICRKK